jgi:hypothetical protein
LTDNLTHYRWHQRWRMIVDRGGPKVARCDLCGERQGTHMHEILSRGRSVKNETARWLSYDRAICSWLCQTCHNEAHNPGIATTLLEKNIQRYGYDAVRAAFDRFNKALRRPVNIPFPERSDHARSNGVT